MNTIQPTLQSITSFKVCGLQVKTRNSNEFNRDTAQIPTLWQQFAQSELAKNPSCFGVYSDYESDANGAYHVTVGIPDEGVHSDLANITIHAGNYLVFKNRGAMPTAVIETWHQIWDYFAKKPEYERSFMTDFETYHGSEEVTIHIGVY